MDHPVRTVTRRNFESPEEPLVGCVCFTFNIGKLGRIAKEFDTDKTNEKVTTIEKGVHGMGRQEIAERLNGRKFLVDRRGRQFPDPFGPFSPDVIDEVEKFMPTPDNEQFISDVDLVNDVREATKFKLWFKSILAYCHIVHINGQDSDLLQFQIRSEPNHTGGFLQALFMGGAEEKDLNVSLCETTHFKLTEDV